MQFSAAVSLSSQDFVEIWYILPIYFRLPNQYSVNVVLDFIKKRHFCTDAKDYTFFVSANIVFIQLNFGKLFVIFCGLESFEPNTVQKLRSEPLPAPLPDQRGVDQPRPVPSRQVVLQPEPERVRHELVLTFVPLEDGGGPVAARASAVTAD